MRLPKGSPMSRDPPWTSDRTGLNRSSIAQNARSKAAIRSQVTCASAVATFYWAQMVETVKRALLGFISNYRRDGVVLPIGLHLGN
jgi:hypothetical protein